MIWSAYMGLPLSLDGVGAVLGLEEQKLKEGKDLIRYFCVPCKPTKANVLFCKLIGTLFIKLNEPVLMG